MEFREKLKKLRAERGVSQQALADAIFVSRSAVAKWENGLGLPCDESYEALAQYFGITRQELQSDQPEQLLVEKNKKMRRLTTVGGILWMVTMLAITAFLCFAMWSDTYDLTSKAAAGVFGDNPCFHTKEYDIYYSTMDVKYQGEIYPTIIAFRPVKKLWIGYEVYEEGYQYRQLLWNGQKCARLYSLQGENGYYHIIMWTLNVIPVEAIGLQSVTINEKQYTVFEHSYFETEEYPVGALQIGDTVIEIGETVQARS